MNVGTIAFCTDQGLGYLARDFYRHGVITHPLLLAHGRRTDHWDWYPKGTERLPTHRGERSIECFKEYLKNKQISHMLFFETPFNWDFLDVCREVGVKTALMPMHECMPATIRSYPDLWLCPSQLDVSWARSLPAPQRSEVTQFPVPIPDEVPFRLRTRAKIFVHNAGNGGLLGRNGTKEVLDAIRLVKVKAEFIIRSQDESVYKRVLELFHSNGLGDHPSITVLPHVPFSQLYAEGDVFLFPERFNGLSLPLQEARASGMLVMCADRFPMNTWLPTEPLIPVDDYRKQRCAGHLAEFDEAIIRPIDIARKIDEWYDADITAYSQSAEDFRTSYCWDNWQVAYIAILNSL